MKKYLRYAGLSLVMVAAVAGISRGDLTPIGDAVEGNSWSQAFNESGVGPFDLVAVRMFSVGDTFENPTHSGFSNPSWSLLYEDSAVTLASAAGNALTSLAWNIRFAGPSSNPLVFDFVAFNGETLLESARATWGPGWSIVAGPWAPSRSEVIPAPGAVLLGLIGLGIVGKFMRRFA